MGKKLRCVMGDVVRRKREQLRLDRYAAAAAMGVDYHRVYRMETNGLRVDDVPLVCQAYKMTPNRLFAAAAEAVEVGSDE